MYVCHVVLDDEDLMDVTRFAKKDDVTIEEWVQTAVDEQVSAELEFEGSANNHN